MSSPEIIGSIGQEEFAKTRVSYDMLFSHHGTPYDIRRLAVLLPQTDIYFPEFYRYSLADKEMFTTVSDGTMSPDEAMNLHHPLWGKNNAGRFLRYELGLVWQTGIHVGFLDVPANHKLTHDDVNCESYVSMPVDLRSMEGERMIRFPYMFDEMLSVHRQFLVDDALFQQEREAYMVDALPKQIDFAVRTNPTLATRPLRALIQLGLFHAPVGDMVRGLGYDTSETVDGASVVPTVGNQISRDIIAGTPVSDERVSRSFMDFVCHDAFGHTVRTLTDDSQKADDALNVLAKVFTLKEIKNVYEHMQRVQSYLEPEVIVAGLLLEKGLRVPESIWDINTLIRYGQNMTDK